MTTDRNLYRRLLDIVAAAGALKKGGKTSYGDKYEYHKVDDVVEHLRPLCIQHGVVMLPSVIERSLGPASETKSGTMQWRAEALLAITFVNADQPDDRVTINGWGEGVDTSDKGVGKAIAYALKNALLATFFLRGQPDVEAEHHEGQRRAQAETRKPTAGGGKSSGGGGKSPLRQLADLIEELGVPTERVTELTQERYGRGPRELREDEIASVMARIRSGSWPADDIDEAMPQNAESAA